MIRARIVISGFVQGVGFRYFLKQKADELGIVGWVRNTDEGAVEAVLEGDEANVNTIVDACREGPPPASVKNVMVAETKQKEELKGFEIRY